VASIVRNLPDTVGTLKDATVQALGNSALLGGEGAKSSGNLTLAPRTPMNVSVTRERAFAAVTLPLHELRALGRIHGATVNDMVLAVCSGALRRYLARRRQLPKKSLVAAVPISLREKGEGVAPAEANQASMSLISLGTHIADIAERLAHIRAASAAMKSTMGGLKKILPTDFPSLGVPWLMEAAASLYGKARVADRIPQVANVVISNVPGPPVALYMAGARMLTNYPASIVVHGMALNITVQSYRHSLDFGLMADGAAMPDVRELADALSVAFDDLRVLPQPGDPGHADTPEAGATVRAAQKAAKTAARHVGRKVGGMLTDAVTDAVKGAVGSVVQAAVSQVTKPARKPRAGAAPAPVKRR
jgi:WS/DGAT/MGAT family acyltransferase